MEQEKKTRVPSAATLRTRAFGRLQHAKQALERAKAVRDAAWKKHEQNVVDATHAMDEAADALKALEG